MQKTGEVMQVVPTQRGGYSGRDGYIYTFNMTINCPDGQFTGEIGSKSQQYPKAVGQEITVDMTQGNYGPKFKAISSQYQGQQQGGPPQEQSYTPPPQAPAPQQQQTFNQQMQEPVKPDWDEIARGKVRCNLVCAAIHSGQMKCENPADAEAYMGYIFTGRIEATGGGPNPDYSDNPPPTQPGDDVPF